MRRRVGVWLAVLAFAWGASEATAGDFTWNSSDDGNWNDDSKWSGTGIPGVGDNVTIDPPDGSVTVTLDTNYEIASLTYGASDTVTIATGSYTLTVATPGTPTANANLVGYWRLDETSNSTADDSKDTSNGTTSGSFAWSTSTKATTPFTNVAAASFTPTATVTIGDQAALEPAALSITFWVKPGASQSAQAVMIVKSHDGTFPAFGVSFNPAPASASNIWFMLGNATTYDVLVGSDTAPASTWSHIACVYDSANSATAMRIYKNGSSTPNATGAKNTAINYGSGTRDVYLGNGTIFPAMDGYLDDVRIYNKVLSTAEIKAIYDEETQTSVSGTITVPASATTTISGKLALGSSNYTFNVGSSATLTVSAVASGSGNLVKTGTGTLKLTGANTYTGTTTVKDGFLYAGAASLSGQDGAFGHAASNILVGDTSGTAVAYLGISGGNHTVSRAITVQANSGTSYVGVRDTSSGVFSGNMTLNQVVYLDADNAGGTATFSGDISGGYAVTKTGSGTVKLSGTNAYTGATTVVNGTLVMGSSTADDGTSGITVGYSSGTSATLVIDGAFTVAKGITVATSTSGTKTIGGTNGAGTTATFSGNVTLNDHVTLSAATATAISNFTGVFSGSKNITVSGAGTVQYNGSGNTYTGSTTVSGTLKYGASDQIADTVAVTVASGATLDLNGFSDTIGSITVNGGTVQTGAGTLTLAEGVAGDPTANANLVGYWRLDETSDSTTEDYSTPGTDEDGTLTGGTAWSTSVPPGIAFTNPRCLQFTGATGSVQIPTNAELANTTGLSITLWVKRNGNQGAQASIFWKDRVGDNTFPGYALTTYPSADTAYASTLRFYLGTAAAYDVCDSSSDCLPDATWVHLACVFKADDANEMIIYKNGNTTPNATANKDTDIDYGTNGNVFLGDSGAVQFAFTGWVDDFRIYNRALTAAEVSSIYGETQAAVAAGGVTETGTSSITGNVSFGSTTREFDVASGGTLTVSAAASGTGGLTKIGDGTLKLSSTTSGYTGVTTVKAGTLLVDAAAPSGSAGALGNASSAVLVGDASSTYAALLTDAAITVGRAITVQAAGTNVVLGANTTDLSEFAGNITLNNDTTLSAPAGGGVRFNTPGVISGSSNVTIDGGGGFWLYGTNTYTGTTTIKGGVVYLQTDAPSGSAGALGNASSAVLLGDTSGTDDALLETGGAYTVGRAITVQSGSEAAAEMVIGGSTAHTSVYSGIITLNKDATLYANSGGTVDFTGTIVGTGDDITLTGAGTIKANSAVSAASLAVNAGRYWIPAAKTTTIDNGGTTTVASGAELYTIGASGSVATLTSGGSHSVNVSSGGSLWGRHFTYSNLSATGVAVSNGGRIVDLSWGTLNKAAGVTGPALDISAVTGANRDKIPHSFQGVTFTGDAGIKNVETGVDAPIVRFFGSNPAYGNRWGETYEDDPGQIPGFAVGRIVWQSGTVKRMTSDTVTDASYDTLKDAFAANTGAAARFRWYENPILSEEIDINDYTLPGAGSHVIEGGIYYPVQPASGTRYAFKDSGAGPRVVLRNAVVARGGVQEMTCQNVTIFQPAGDGTNVQDTTSCTFVNCIREVANTGTTEIVDTDDLTLKTSDGATYFAGHSLLDYHLKSTAASAIDDGSDQSGTYARDFEEGTRAAPFDIGADEYKAGLVAVYLESQASAALAGDIGTVSRIHTVGARGDSGPYGYMMTMGGSSGSENDYFYVVKYAGGAGSAPKIVAKRAMSNPVHNFMYYKIANNNIKIYALVDTNDDGYADAIHAMTDSGGNDDTALTDDATFNGREGYQPGGAGGRMKFINVWRPESSLWRLFVVKAPNGSGDEGTLYKINADVGDSTDDADQQYGEIIWNSGVERKYDWRSPMTTNGAINEAFLSVSNDGSNHLVVRKPLTGNSNPAISVSFTGGLSGGQNIGGQTFGYVGTTRYLMVAPAGGQMFSVEMQGVSSDTRWVTPDMGGTLRGQPTKYINTQFVVCGMDDSVVKVVEKGGSDDDGIACGFGGDTDTDWPMDCKGNVSTWILMNGTSQLYWGTDQGACYGATFDPTYHATPETGDEAVISGFPYYIPGHRVVWTFRVPSNAGGAGIYFVTDQGAVLRIPHQ